MNVKSSLGKVELLSCLYTEHQTWGKGGAEPGLISV